VVRSRVRPISADVVRLGGEGEHAYLQAIASLAHGETRGDKAVVGDDQQSGGAPSRSAALAKSRKMRRCAATVNRGKASMPR
jgi:hypothetical protein